MARRSRDHGVGVRRQRVVARSRRVATCSGSTVAWRRRLASIDGGVGRCLLAGLDGGARRHGERPTGADSCRVGRDAPVIRRSSGRERWYTPWGGPPDTRSLSSGPGGRVRERPRRRDPPSARCPGDMVADDRHRCGRAPGAQPTRSRRGTSSRRRRSGWPSPPTAARPGASSPTACMPRTRGRWRWTARSLMSASVGPRGGRAAVYRRPAGEMAFIKCTGGLPEWFGQNIDSHSWRLPAVLVVFGADGGRLFVSEDGGRVLARCRYHLPGDHLRRRSLREPAAP